MTTDNTKQPQYALFLPKAATFLILTKWPRCVRVNNNIATAEKLTNIEFQGVKNKI